MRTVSITFDDGLWETTKLAVVVGRALSQRYSFYPVADWVEGSSPNDPYNAGHYHGSVDGWKGVAELGHEIGSHTMSHCRSGTPQFREECARSLEWLKQFGPPPYSFAFPFDITGPKPDGFIVARGGELWGDDPYIDMGARLPDVVHSVNPVWDCEIVPFDRIYGIVDGLPDNHWLIINLHGVDEGWGPIRTEDLHGLTHYLSALGVAVKPVREVAGALCHGGHHLQPFVVP